MEAQLHGFLTLPAEGSVLTSSSCRITTQTIRTLWRRYLAQSSRPYQESNRNFRPNPVTTGLHNELCCPSFPCSWATAVSVQNATPPCVLLMTSAGISSRWKHAGKSCVRYRAVGIFRHGNVGTNQISELRIRYRIPSYISVKTEKQLGKCFRAVALNGRTCRKFKRRVLRARFHSCPYELGSALRRYQGRKNKVEGNVPIYGRSL